MCATVTPSLHWRKCSKGKRFGWIESFYGYNSACVRVAGSMGSCFRVNNALKCQCKKFPRLFNIYKDGVVKKRLP